MSSFFFKQVLAFTGIRYHVTHNMLVLMFFVYRWFQRAVFEWTNMDIRAALGMAWNSGGGGGGCPYILRGRYKTQPKLILIYLLKLLRNSSLIWSTTVFPEYEIALLKQCVEWTIYVLLPGSSPISDEMPISCSRIATVISAKYTRTTSPFIITNCYCVF
jgi:hypothetical protein